MIKFCHNWTCVHVALLICITLEERNSKKNRKFLRRKERNRKEKKTDLIVLFNKTAVFYIEHCYTIHIYKFSWVQFSCLAMSDSATLWSLSRGFPRQEYGAVCHLLLQGSYWPSNRTRTSCIGKWVLYHWVTCEALIMGSVQFSHSVVSDSLQPHGLKHTRPPYHRFLESTQTHVHWVGDVIQPSPPLSAPSPPALNLSQHQGLFQWVNSSHQVAKLLQLQHQSSNE